ncbi:hypothetical protein GHT06_004492 [Daphnia sinensis]|uniref:Uncharacterized protein n=1 Tax=Daphnia sinensis TaxID=1820382 RepID=A0AAD5PNM5_9CRUS|nr:hypothetical protein GHT06_004492 [Daphnia sinensis]
MDTRDRQAAAIADSKMRNDLRSRSLAPLPIGKSVRVQDPISKLRSHVGVVVAIGRYCAFRIKFARSGRQRKRRENDASQAAKQLDTDGTGARGDNGSTAPRTPLPASRRSGCRRQPKIIDSM